MKLLVIAPGASWSTADVHDAMFAALETQGHDLIRFRLDTRIARASSWLRHCWAKIGRPDPRPTDADVLYQAGMGIIEKALRFEVDCVLAVSAMYLHPDFVVLLKRAGIRLAILFTESPYDD